MGRRTVFQISKLPEAGFMLGFWFLVDDITKTQNLLFHTSKDKNKNTSFELLVDSSSIVFVIKQKQGSPGELIRMSKKNIRPNRWYFGTLYFQDNILNLKVRSSDYQFSILEKFSLGDSDSIFFGNNQNNNPLKGRINKVTLAKYSDSQKNKFRKDYNKMESSLYAYQRQLRESDVNERIAILEDTIKINQQIFYIEIWDYSEYDGDEIQIKT